ncbi:MAG: hypothetical protein QNJ90_09465 [Planctomycetota bacterium]|nr:hypothetical protein [Planctomycetota bacterium]
MDRSTLRCCTALLAGVALLTLAACSGSPLTSAGTATTAATTAAPVYNAWTTPGGGGTYAARGAQAAALQPAPVAVATTPAPTLTPAAATTVWAQADAPTLPPPPDTSLPVMGAPTAAPTVTQPCPPEPCAPVTTTQLVTPERTYSGCWPPCNDGISQWHVRGVIGLSFSEGTDDFEDCNYWGVDVGRTFCGCWGLDLYYRYNTGRFSRDEGQGVFKDGGTWHHFGAKITFEKAFARSSRFYVWGGVGAGYFTTDDYVNDDSGFEIYGEAGVGYNVSENWRVRAGVNIHGMDTDVTRFSPVNDGDSRWLWIFAPVIQLEGSF